MQNKENKNIEEQQKRRKNVKTHPGYIFSNRWTEWNGPEPWGCSHLTTRTPFLRMWIALNKWPMTHNKNYYEWNKNKKNPLGHCQPPRHSTVPLLHPINWDACGKGMEKVPCILWDRGCRECDAIAMSAPELYLGSVPGHVHQDSIESSKHKNGSCSTMLLHAHTLTFCSIFFFECVRERGISVFLAHFFASKEKDFKL